MGRSNLECFLRNTTPVVPAHTLPKFNYWHMEIHLLLQVYFIFPILSSNFPMFDCANNEMGRPFVGNYLESFEASEAIINGSFGFPIQNCLKNINSEWQPLGKDTVQYFSLGDLWDRYDEWSAYGVGSPIRLDNGETVVQYYTPYLSAIQIYTSKSMYSRDTCGDSEGESETNSWSGESEDRKLSRSSSSNSDKTWDMEEMGIGLESCWSTRSRFGELYFEHFEGDGPFGRIPLKDKIDALAQKHHGLKSFYSLDLSPASWMAVAWYPIYNIPACRNAKELYASFLTYHTLSSSFQDAEQGGGDDKGGEIEVTSLPPFGLATYRMQPRIWMEEAADYDRVCSLGSAAESWLKQLQVHHHDFNYFVTHAM